MNARALAPGILLLSLLLIGCGPTPAAGPGQATCQQVKPAGAVQVSLGTAPCPARAGRETIVVKLLDGSQQPVSVSKASVRYWMVGMDMPGLPKDISLSQGQEGLQTSLPMGMSGPWMLQVRIQQSAQGEATAEFEVNVQ